MRRFHLLGPLFLLSSMAACGSGGGSGDGDAYQSCVSEQTRALTAAAGVKHAPQGPFSAGLLETNPDELASLLREDLKESMRASLNGNRASRIASLRCEHLRPPPDNREYAASAAPSANAGASSGAAQDGAKEASGTNNQVAGVDEADFIKNDNKYIYVVNGSRLRVIEAWPAETAHEIANVAIPGEARKLFVEGNRAVVYSAVAREPRGSTGSSYSMDS